MSDIEIVILPDGTFLVPRGVKEQNDMVRELFSTESNDPEGLDGFLSMTDDVEILFGESTYCG